MTSPYQYPVEKHRDLERRWGRLLERGRACAPRKSYPRAEKDGLPESESSARERAALVGLEQALTYPSNA